MTVSQFVALNLKGELNQAFAIAVIKTLTPDDKDGRSKTKNSPDDLRTRARELQTNVKEWLSKQNKGKGKGKGKQKRQQSQGKGGAKKKKKKK